MGVGIIFCLKLLDNYDAQSGWGNTALKSIISIIHSIPIGITLLEIPVSYVSHFNSLLKLFLLHHLSLSILFDPLH